MTQIAPWTPPPEDQRPDEYRCLVLVKDHDSGDEVGRFWTEGRWSARSSEWVVSCMECHGFTVDVDPIGFAPIPGGPT